MEKKAEAKTVPVRRDARTFDQRRKDMMHNLRTCIRHNAQPTSNEASKQPPVGNRQVAVFGWPRWETNVDRWIEDMFRGWDHDLHLMRNNMFPLVPTGLFGSHWMDTFTPFGDAASILDRMDRQLDAINRHVSGLGLNANAGKSLDFLQNAYELGEDGKVHFKLGFDVQGYKPEEIEVTTSEHGVKVHAKHSTKTDTSSTSQEFCRTIYLPDSIDRDKVQCHLTKDGVLMLEAPVRVKQQDSIAFTGDSKLAIKPESTKAALQKSPPNGPLALQPTGVLGPSVVKDATTGGSKVHVEFPIDPDFEADDLQVRMDGDNMVVSGRKECVDDKGTSKSCYVKEFKRAYSIPEVVDTFSMNAQLHGNTLLVEAPVIRPSTSG